MAIGDAAQDRAQRGKGRRRFQLYIYIRKLAIGTARQDVATPALA